MVSCAVYDMKNRTALIRRRRKISKKKLMQATARFQFAICFYKKRPKMVDFTRLLRLQHYKFHFLSRICSNCLCIQQGPTHQYFQARIWRSGFTGRTFLLGLVFFFISYVSSSGDQFSCKQNVFPIMHCCVFMHLINQSVISENLGFHTTTYSQYQLLQTMLVELSFLLVYTPHSTCPPNGS